MSRILSTDSTDSGSLDSLNVWLPCGGKPNDARIRRILGCEKPGSAAIERIDQRRISRLRPQRPFDHGGNLIVVRASHGQLIHWDDGRTEVSKWCRDNYRSAGAVGSSAVSPYVRPLSRLLLHENLRSHARSD